MSVEENIAKAGAVQNKHRFSSATQAHFSFNNPPAVFFHAVC